MLGEGFVIYSFFSARAAYRQDLKGPCFDECLGTFLGMVWWGFWIFAWPFVALILAALARGVWAATPSPDCRDLRGLT
jgi:hypothetical protein